MQCNLLVLVIVLVTCVPSVIPTDCPTSCQCRDFPLESDTSDTILTTVQCKGDAGTLQLPVTTSNIVLSRVTHTSLSALFARLVNPNVTVKLPRLTDIAIVQSELTNIDRRFGHLKWLRSLDVSQNAIKLLPTGEINTLKNLTNLTTLDLSCNRIKILSDKPFATLTHLERLNLSANFIHNISNDAFYGASGLQYLDLSINNLSVLGEEVFAPLTNLQYLNLSVNRLETLGEECFSQLGRLQQLDVSHNRLTSVAPGALQALPSLARLLLAGNPSLGDLLVGTGRRLQTVDASRTGLAHVPPALTHSVRTLRLAGNAIHSVRCGDFDSYPLLQLLDFTANGLENVEDDSLGRQEMLSTLYLTDNKLRVVPRSLPAGLKTLHLEQNRIEHLKVGEMSGLTQLEVLLLNDNDILTIEEGSFDDLTSLVTLDISGNPLTMLGGGVLAGLVSLQVLRLAGLPVATAARDTAFPVHAPERLVILDLTASPGLARVFLADNAALAASRELQELSVADAGLVHLRSDLLHFLPQLRMLKLDGNRLDCSHLLWLAIWMRQQNRPEDRVVLCASPPDLAGSLIIDLQEGDLPSVTTVKTTIIKSKHLASKAKLEQATKKNYNVSTKNSLKTTVSPLVLTTQLRDNNNSTIVHLSPKSAKEKEQRVSSGQVSKVQTASQRNLYPIIATTINNTVIKKYITSNQSIQRKSSEGKPTSLTKTKSKVASIAVTTAHPTLKVTSAENGEWKTLTGYSVKPLRRWNSPPTANPPISESTRSSLNHEYVNARKDHYTDTTQRPVQQEQKLFTTSGTNFTVSATTDRTSTEGHEITKTPDTRMMNDGPHSISLNEFERTNSNKKIKEINDLAKTVVLSAKNSAEGNKTRDAHGDSVVNVDRKVLENDKSKAKDATTTAIDTAVGDDNTLDIGGVSSASTTGSVSRPRYILDPPAEAMSASHGESLTGGNEHVTAATYMFSSGGGGPARTLAHPGMLVLVLVLLCAVGAALALTMLASHFTRRRRRRRNGDRDVSEHEDIALEIGHMPGVTDLW